MLTLAEFALVHRAGVVTVEARAACPAIARTASDTLSKGAAAVVSHAARALFLLRAGKESVEQDGRSVARFHGVGNTDVLDLPFLDSTEWLNRSDDGEVLLDVSPGDARGLEATGTGLLTLNA